MAAIIKSTIASASQDNLISYIDNRTYIKDPRNPNLTTKTRTMVYEFDPMAKMNNFGDFPYIVCEFPTIDYSHTSTDGKVKNIGWKHKITIRTLRDGAGNTRTDVGRADMMAMTDDLHELFNTETNKQGFRDLNMFQMQLTTIGSDAYVVSNDDRMCYETTYEVTYYTRLEVSS
jgi:hypothetical protein